MDHYINENIFPGVDVEVVLKKDQGTGKLTRGVVETLLTSKPYHPRGIKVRLIGGLVGRVQKIYGDSESAPDDQGYQV